MSMRVTDGFRAFVLEQLAGVEFVRARALFGGCRLVTVIDRFHYVTRASSGWAVILDCAEGRHFNLNPCPETTAGGLTRSWLTPPRSSPWLGSVSCFRSVRSKTV